MDQSSKTFFWLETHWLICLSSWDHWFPYFTEAIWCMCHLLESYSSRPCLAAILFWLTAALHDHQLNQSTRFPDWAHLAICLSHWVLFSFQNIWLRSEFIHLDQFSEYLTEIRVHTPVISFQNIWLRSEFIPPDQAGIALSLTDSQLWKSSIYHLNNMAMTLHLPRVESKWIGESISVICLVWWN